MVLAQPDPGDERAVNVSVDAKLEAFFSGEPPSSIDQIESVQEHVQTLAEKVQKTVVGIGVGAAQGSGVIISRDGYVLTAAHVSGKPGLNARLFLSDGRVVPAKTLGLNNTFDAGLMNVFCKHDVSYILKATNANSIAHLVWDNQVTPELVAELQKDYQVVTIKPSAIVCTIGSNIGIPGVLAKAAQALADARVNVNCVSQTLRQVNMQFVIEREDYKTAIKDAFKALKKKSIVKCIKHAN